MRFLRQAPLWALLAAAIWVMLPHAAEARSVWQFFDDPPAPHTHPMTDDGGRAWRTARGFGYGVFNGGSAIVAEAMRFLGGGNPTGTGYHNWCADYTSMVLRKTGHRPLANRMAASALSYGPHVRDPRPGDLVVMATRRGYASHVGFFGGWDHGRVVLVSGNWGHRVARALVSARSVVAFVRV